MDSISVHIRKSITAVLQPSEGCVRRPRLREPLGWLRASLVSEGSAHLPETGA